MMQQNDPGTPKQQLRAMNVLCTALMSGVVIFLIIIVALVKWNDGGFGKDSEVNKYFSVAVIIIAAICLISGIVSYKKRIDNIPPEILKLDAKLDYYRAALILYFASCEGGSLFAIIVIFLTGNFLLVVVVAILLVAMFLMRPVKQRVVDELKLNWEEEQQLN